MGKIEKATQWMIDLAKMCIRDRIMSLFFFQYKTDSEIAEQLHVSRQYVNRIKKQLITEYFHES